jgi:hypothetical protein
MEGSFTTKGYWVPIVIWTPTSLIGIVGKYHPLASIFIA